MAKNSGIYFYTYRGRKIYEPPRYMSVNQAAQQLLEIVQNQRIRGEEPGTQESSKGSHIPLMLHWDEYVTSETHTCITNTTKVSQCVCIHFFLIIFFIFPLNLIGWKFYLKVMDFFLVMEMDSF